MLLSSSTVDFWQFIKILVLTSWIFFELNVILPQSSIFECSNSSIWRNFAPRFHRRNKTDTTATQATDDFTKKSIFVATMSIVFQCTHIIRILYQSLELSNENQAQLHIFHESFFVSQLTFQFTMNVGSMFLFIIFVWALNHALHY